MTRLFYAVTGGRGYRNYQHVARVLDEEKPGVVVQGECPKGGADLLAKRWCRKNGVPCIGVEALWDFYGNAAGPIRNEWMFDLLPIYKLVAFPGDRGTNHAVQQARFRQIPVRDERQPALAAATGTAKTPKAVECEASQSGPAEQGHG
jgi:hypothetical protein